ncbi:alpha-L-fucosidase [Friedmanniella endophytica]|uniref:alpha-L-fucosidase n=1 Tax=Microlunatus kandeliicorticis TaxID=1759536 RepID=A0A7W3IQ91_9ACTN|nr:alpha-L-fucosidase [Microlunatus kandeliicorticis]MBA8793224.1 alpha-L-fucosidase [Microlunatus kandeliicorticis]
MIIAPTVEQLAWQRAQVGVFFHFGVNTFTDREWGDGSESPEVFDPAELDAAQWAQAAVDVGARYVVLTAKHHDGFCLWPTATTDHSVASSPWRGGRGDVVEEVLTACRAAGLEVGLYLSPWDRHDPRYADPEAYDRLYLAQLTELCTRYGQLFELWFDGAGSEGRRYAWDRYMDTARGLQPQAMIFNLGRPTIRWVGNEDGLAADPMRYQVRLDELTENEHRLDPPDTELYLPPECDVSIRPGWFHHAQEEPKATDHLLDIHDRSVGLGANLLLNLPPDRRGLVPENDLAAIGDYRAALAARRPVDGRLTRTGDHRAELALDQPADRVVLAEELGAGQRVTGVQVVDAEHPERVLATAGSVGVSRTLALTGASEVRTLRIDWEGEDADLTAATGLRG